jgi:hypothetical protein
MNGKGEGVPLSPSRKPQIASSSWRRNRGGECGLCVGLGVQPFKLTERGLAA